MGHKLTLVVSSSDSKVAFDHAILGWLYRSLFGVPKGNLPAVH